MQHKELDVINLSRKVLCLDWDKRSLRIVVARVGGGEMQLEDAHALHIPSGVNCDDAEAMGAFIAQALRRHQVKIKRVIVDVPRDKAVINSLSVPPTPDNELAAAVRFQAMRELPFPVDQAAIDYVVNERNDDGQAVGVLLAAVRRETLERLRETCVAAGLTPARIGLRPYANLISISHLPAMHDRKVLFLDVGPQMTEIDVLHAHALEFSRSANVNIPMHGGEVVSDDSRVSSKSELSELELEDAVETAAVGELLVEITRTLQAYRATAKGESPVDQIVIGGGTDIEHALLEAVSDRFDIPATLFDPTPTLGVDESDAGKLRAFASTLGLAWGLSDEGLLEIDFLNPKRTIPPQETLKRRLRIAGAAVAVVILGTVGAVASNLINKQRELDGLLARNSEKLKEALANQQFDFQRLEVLEWDTEAQAGVWLDHLLDLTRMAEEFAPGKKMLITKLDFNASTTSVASIDFTLLCDDVEIANELVRKLNEHEVDGKRIYLAKMGQYQGEAKSFDPRFTAKVPIVIELLDLQSRKPLKTRERDYKKLERTLKNG